ncbi:hypothetical protein LOD99_4854 [Oopsacas minuta]|uniref:FAM194 C-terminal domain-containing protein n=1 Tax=Oopsacas minuta TaxID=111878 RepID=A0AAV7JRV1_9METZ|nr:hypothetical protein LOD99_4854 [Oopsacas minuta]
MSFKLPQIENKTFFYSQKQKRTIHRHKRSEDELRAIFGDRTSIRFQLAPNTNKPDRKGSAVSWSERPISAVSSSSGRTKTHSQSEEKSVNNKTPVNSNRNSVILPQIRKVSGAITIAEEFDLSVSETNLLLQAEREREENIQGILTFQEAKFAATGILSQLSVYLSRKLPASEELLSLTLIRNLQLGFSDLSRNVIVPVKKWQTDYYVDTETGRPFKRHPRSILKQLRSMKASSNKQRKKTSFLDVKSDFSTTGSDMSDNEDTHSSGLAILQYRRESKLPSIHYGTPKTRAEKQPYTSKVTDLSASASKKKLSSQIDPSKIELTADNVTIDVEAAVYHPGGEQEDPERHTLIELAKERLKAAIKSKKDLQIQAHQRQADGPLELKYYGERHMPAKVRVRKITHPYVTLSSNFVITLQQEDETQTDEHEAFKRKKFILTLPDSSSTWFYPSGRIALQISRGSHTHKSPYVNLFNDTDQTSMIASFTSTGKGCCYHDNGYLSLKYDLEGGVLMDKRGWIERKWEWPVSNMKLSTSIILNLNSSFILRCTSQSSVVIIFKCNGECVSTNVGYVEEQNEVKMSALIQEATSALSIGIGKRKRLKKRASRILDDSFEKFDIDLSIAEFLVYKDRIRGLVNDWLEFYRVALKINCPTPLPRSPSPEFGRYNRPTPVIWNFSTPPPNIPVGGMSRQSSRPHSRVSAFPAMYGMGMSTEGAIEHSRIYSPDLLANNSEFVPMTEDSPEDRKALSHSSYKKTVLEPVTRNSCPSTLSLSVINRILIENKCSCDRKQKRRISSISDVEFDVFIRSHLPADQLCVVCIFSSKIPNSFVSEIMLNTLHYQRNKYRAMPCIDSDGDLYRLFKYDLATAADEACGGVPLLVERHKAEPGMFFMYLGGKLVFADFVFNGYGNAQRDFSKQVRNALLQAKAGEFLPDNFKFSSIPKKSITSQSFPLLSASHRKSDSAVKYSDGVTLDSLFSFQDTRGPKLSTLA